MTTAGTAQVTDGNYDAWRQEVQNYTASKKTQQYVQEPYHKVTNEHVKRKEVEYNPIT